MFYKRVITIELKNDIIDDDSIDNSISLDEFNLIIDNQHWYDKKLFNLYYKDNLKLREISELTGINIKSINNSIVKTRKDIKKQIQKYVDDNNLY
jgi:DNA-directed RNA polymerase specialized sigma24 family protein